MSTQRSLSSPETGPCIQRQLVRQLSFCLFFETQSCCVACVVFRLLSCCLILSGAGVTGTSHYARF